MKAYAKVCPPYIITPYIITLYYMLKTGYKLQVNILYILAHAAIQSYIYIEFILTNTFSKKSKIEYANMHHQIELVTIAKHDTINNAILTNYLQKIIVQYATL